MDVTRLLEQVLQDHGLLGLLLVIVLLGPGYTYLKIRNMQAKVEAKTHAMMNEFARHEQQRADRCEEYLKQTQERFDRVEKEFFQLREKYHETEPDNILQDTR